MYTMISDSGFTRLTSRMNSNVRSVSPSGSEGGEGGGEGESGGPTPLDTDALKTYLQNLDPEDFGKFTP